MNKNQPDITVNIKCLQAALLKCYTRDLCYPRVSEKWTEGNKCFGMCAITALITNDYMGGKIGKTYVNNMSHYFNIINDEVVDLTASQFNHPIDYSNYQPAQRKDILANDNTSKRYALLKERLSVLGKKREKSLWHDYY